LKKCRPKKESALKSGRQQAGRDERERERERVCVCLWQERKQTQTKEGEKRKGLTEEPLKTLRVVFSLSFPRAVTRVVAIQTG